MGKIVSKKLENRKKPISLLPVIGQNHEIIGILRLHDLIQAGLS